MSGVRATRRCLDLARARQLIHCENVRSRGVAAIGDAKGQRQQGVVERPSVWIMQKKTQRPVQFELTEQTRDVETWVARIGLDPGAYGTHSLRRTKATLIYRNQKSPGSSTFARAYEISCR